MPPGIPPVSRNCAAKGSRRGHRASSTARFRGGVTGATLVFKARNDSVGGTGTSRAPDHALAGHGSDRSRSLPPNSLLRNVLPPTAAVFSRASRRRWSASSQLAAVIAACSAVGTPPRCSSTTRVRRCTSIDGMSMRTGHTSKQAPHRLDA